MLKKYFIAFLIALQLVAVQAFASSLSMSINQSEFSMGETITIYFALPSAGYVDVLAYDENHQQQSAIAQEFEGVAGLNQVKWNGTNFGEVVPTGAYTISVTFGDFAVHSTVHFHSDVPAPTQAPVKEKDVEATQVPNVEPTQAPTAHPQHQFYPGMRGTHVPSHVEEGCYFCTPMNIKDEAAVWKMLTSPMTVVDLDQKRQLVIRSEPNSDSKGVGVITGASQGVHVLEKLDNGWTLVETYSSSFHDSAVKEWNAYVKGYVPSSSLMVKTPSQKYGLLVDKLTQRLYIFKEGKLFSTLLASTGLYNDRQPYNETRAGEFMLISKSGGFKSDNLICPLGIRYNGGDLLHEVPHVLNGDGSKNLRNTEPKLGTRASHGCIRTQRLKSPEGVNMQWIWNNVPVGKNGAKLVIWEDFQGRYMETPSDDTPLYYNAKGGSYYHTDEMCPTVRDQYLPLDAFTYGELENDAFKDLLPCRGCGTVDRVAHIEKINSEHETQSPGMVDDYHIPREK